VDGENYGRVDRSGHSLSSVVPSPSSPLTFLPQQYALPFRCGHAAGVEYATRDGGEDYG